MERSFLKEAVADNEHVAEGSFKGPNKNGDDGDVGNQLPVNVSGRHTLGVYKTRAMLIDWRTGLAVGTGRVAVTIVQPPSNRPRECDQGERAPRCAQVVSIRVFLLPGDGPHARRPFLTGSTISISGESKMGMHRNA